MPKKAEGVELKEDGYFDPTDELFTVSEVLDDNGTLFFWYLGRSKQQRKISRAPRSARSELNGPGRSRLASNKQESSYTTGKDG